MVRRLIGWLVGRTARAPQFAWREVPAGVGTVRYERVAIA